MRDHNEDSYLVEPPVFAVADGMGGHAAGEVASRLAVESLSGSSLSAASNKNAVREALTGANAMVFDQAQGSSRGMGTTCALLVMGEGTAVIGHVGDSRIYRVRDGQLQQLTRDHTLVAEMVDQGLINPDDALVDDNRGFLARALGGSASVEVDVETVDVLADDRFVLCSDGLTTMVDDAAIETILNTHSDAQEAADKLVEAANAAGGEDNVTVLVVDTPASPRDEQPADTEQSAPRRSRLLTLGVAVLLLVVVVVAVYRLILFPT